MKDFADLDNESYTRKTWGSICRAAGYLSEEVQKLDAMKIMILSRKLMNAADKVDDIESFRTYEMWGKHKTCVYDTDYIAFFQSRKPEFLQVVRNNIAKDFRL